MVDIDCYGIPIRMPESQQHMSSDSFWAENTTDSLTQPAIIGMYADVAGSLSPNGIMRKGNQRQPLVSGQDIGMWSATCPDVAADANWSSSCQQSSSLTASLQCSASDLQLCLGLQMRAETAASTLPPRTTKTYLSSQPRCKLPAHDLTESQAELAQFNQSAPFDASFFGSLEGQQVYSNSEISARQATSLLEEFTEKRDCQILSMPSQNITHSAYVGNEADRRRFSLLDSSKELSWMERKKHFSEANADIDLSDISLRFSPFKSMTGEPFPTFSSSDDGDSSFSSSAENVKSLATAGAIGAALNKNKKNYFLTFEDANQSGILTFEDANQSGISSVAWSMRQSEILKSSASIFSSREGKMDDSGALSSTEAGVGRTRHTSTTSNKMKCWTDVIDDEADGEDVFKEQSFIASLSKERKPRSSSSQKLSTGCSNGSSENLTSGYSTSSMNGSGNGTGGFAYRPQLLRPTQRVRQSPSLPLNLQSGGETPPKLTAQYGPAMGSTIPRSRCSAPDLKFLGESQKISQSRVVPGQPPLSCPDRTGLPFRVNRVEDWESLRVLLPAAFQKAFAEKAKNQGIPHPSRSVSLPERLGISDENVCRTCFKVQNSLSDMAASACDCSSSSSSSSTTTAHKEPLGTPRRQSQVSPQVSPRTPQSLFSPGRDLRRTSLDRQDQAPPATNLMEFSRRLNDDSPTQIIINLKQKQELVTFVKAAAMGLVGFRQIRKDHSDNLSHLIERQLTLALHALLEDGLRPGYTVWSSIVKQCSPTLYRQHLAILIEANESLTNDQDRFHAFIKELLRLSDLNAWLMQVAHGNDPSVLRRYYSMDGFLFLANSVTKELWDDLMDTLSWLSGSSSQSYCESFMQADSGVKHSPRYQSSPGRSAEQNASSNSVRRLASKLGRRISLLPVCSPNGIIGKTKPLSRGNTTALPHAAAPPVPVRKMFTTAPVSSIQLPQQPHLPMSTRWSDWTLSQRDHALESSPLKSSQRLEIHCAVKSRKSPSMFDIRSVIL